jgi:hypothetical protein
MPIKNAMTRCLFLDPMKVLEVVAMGRFEISGSITMSFVLVTGASED